MSTYMLAISATLLAGGSGHVATQPLDEVEGRATCEQRATDLAAKLPHTSPDGRFSFDYVMCIPDPGTNDKPIIIAISGAAQGPLATVWRWLTQ